MTAAIERHCPFCDHPSTYGGGDRPREMGGLVYRRRRCLSDACGRRFVVVEGIVSENALLQKVLVAYHEAEQKGERKMEGVDLPGAA
jgi:transcriptional regulator NrdR family protein